MNVQTIQAAQIRPSDLQPGNKILNVGVVTRVDEYTNVVVVHLRADRINNLRATAQLPKYDRVWVDAVDGKVVVLK